MIKLNLATDKICTVNPKNKMKTSKNQKGLEAVDVFFMTLMKISPWTLKDADKTSLISIKVHMGLVSKVPHLTHQARRMKLFSKQEKRSKQRLKKKKNS